MPYPTAEDDGPIAITTWAVRQDPVVITLGGQLDTASSPALREELLNLLHPGVGLLVLDLSAIQHADTSGLAVLIGCQHRTALLGGTLRLAAPGPAVAGVLEATGISRHLDIYPTIQAAIAGRGSAIAGQVRAAVVLPALPAQLRGERDVTGATGGVSGHGVQ